MQYLALAALMGTLVNALPAPIPHNPEVIVYEKAAVKTEIVTVAAPGQTFTPATYQKDTEHEHHHHHHDQPESTSSSTFVPTSTPAPEQTYTPAPTSSTPPAQASPTSSYGSTTGGDSAPGNMAAALKAHNDYRAKHSAPALTWDSDLAASAQSANEKFQCAMQHSGAGENLAGGYTDVVAAVAAWYNENKDFNYQSGGFGENTGHFTQVVWKSTTHLGCAINSCGSP